MREHIYRVQIVLQELDTDGFWDIFNSIEMSNDKEKLNESLERIYANSKKYIDERLE